VNPGAAARPTPVARRYRPWSPGEERERFGRKRLAAGEKLRVAAGVEVADEAGETVLELHVPAVRAPVVDDHDAEILERALEHAAAPFPGGAARRKFIERVEAVLDANPIHAPQHLVEPSFRRRGGSGSVAHQYRHGSECTPRVKAS
jgi:hypothetical protein